MNTQTLLLLESITTGNFNLPELPEIESVVDLLPMLISEMQQINPYKRPEGVMQGTEVDKYCKCLYIECVIEAQVSYLKNNKKHDLALFLNHKMIQFSNITRELRNSITKSRVTTWETLRDYRKFYRIYCGIIQPEETRPQTIEVKQVESTETPHEEIMIDITKPKQIIREKIIFTSSNLNLATQDKVKIASVIGIILGALGVTTVAILALKETIEVGKNIVFLVPTIVFAAILLTSIITLLITKRKSQLQNNTKNAPSTTYLCEVESA
ncbi:MAG: hypothetical protein LBJ93_02860 [Clostridiales bacterium]|jgi:hypothetical protein|nr:hypothetical protein [Clostridiales bacterium]